MSVKINSLEIENVKRIKIRLNTLSAGNPANEEAVNKNSNIE